MLTIRLQRTGKKNQADFRIVLAEKEAPVKKKHLEVLGAYNPRRKDFKVNDERVKYWITQRVELSPTVHNLFVTKGLLEGAKKVKAFNTPKKAPEAVVPVVEAAPATEAPASPAASTEPVIEKAVVPDGSEKSEKSDKTEEPAKVE